MSIISYFREENLPVRPWTRYFARTGDMCVFFIILYPIIRIFFTSLLHKPIIILFISVAWYIFAEAILLSKVGTTLGKWLLRVTVTDKEGKRLSFSTALKRTFLVYLKGFALGLPYVNLVTLIIAYKRLKANQITSWDRDCQTTVTHQNSAIPVWIIVVVAPFILSFIMFRLLLSEMKQQFNTSLNVSEKNISAQIIPAQTATVTTPNNVPSNNLAPKTPSQPSVQNPINGRPSWVQDIPKNERPSWIHEVPSNESTPPTPSHQSISAGD